MKHYLHALLLLAALLFAVPANASPCLDNFPPGASQQAMHDTCHAFWMAYTWNTTTTRPEFYKRHCAMAFNAGIKYTDSYHSGCYSPSPIFEGTEGQAPAAEQPARTPENREQICEIWDYIMQTLYPKCFFLDESKVYFAP